MNCWLNIDGRDEELGSSSFPPYPRSGRLLFISSALMEAFSPLLKRETAPEENEVGIAWQSFTEKLSAPPFQDSPVTLDAALLHLHLEGLTFPPHLLIFAEAKAISVAVGQWLGGNPSQLQDTWSLLLRAEALAGEVHDSVLFHESFAAYCFGYRVRRTITVPQVSGDRIIRYHTFQGLLTACWLEIWYCAEHAIPARVCEHCGKVFLLPHVNHLKKICGSKECTEARDRKNRKNRGPEYSRNKVMEHRAKKQKKRF